MVTRKRGGREKKEKALIRTVKIKIDPL